MWIIPGLIKEENVKHITGILRDTAMEDDWINIYYDDKQNKLNSVDSNFWFKT